MSGILFLAVRHEKKTVFLEPNETETVAKSLDVLMDVLNIKEEFTLCTQSKRQLDPNKTFKDEQISIPNEVDPVLLQIIFKDETGAWVIPENPTELIVEQEEEEDNEEEEEEGEEEA
eukprot:m.37162 g.37162  ORF g.37162 m.37162 type:complete len:117 (-) comp6724_c0_seq3:175-525(-)